MEDTTTADLPPPTTMTTTLDEIVTAPAFKGFCYKADLNPSNDVCSFFVELSNLLILQILVAAIFIVFLCLLLTALLWRIYAGIQTIRRYRYKIMVLSVGPVLDGTYFDNAPNYATTQNPAAPLLKNEQQ